MHFHLLKTLFLSSSDATGRWVMPLTAMTFDPTVKAVGVQRWRASPYSARPPTLANLCIFTVALVVSIQALSWCTLGVGLIALRNKVACLSNTHTAVNHYSCVIYTDDCNTLLCHWEEHDWPHTHSELSTGNQNKTNKKKVSNTNERVAYTDQYPGEIVQTLLKDNSAGWIVADTFQSHKYSID